MLNVTEGTLALLMLWFVYSDKSLTVYTVYPLGSSLVCQNNSMKLLFTVLLLQNKH